MKILARITTGLVAAAVTLSLGWTAFADGKEEKVKLEDCPAAVQKTIKAKAGDGKVVEVEKETKKDGTVVYEAEIKTADGKEVEITVGADGKVIDVEDEDDDDDGEDEDDDDGKA